MTRSALAQFQNERKKAVSIKFQVNALNIAKTTYFIINSSIKGHDIGRPGVIGGAGFYKIGQMRTKRRGCAFHFAEIFYTSWTFSLYFVHIFRTTGIFLRNLAVVILVSIVPFWHSYTWNLKHLSIRELDLFITVYYFQVPWHDMNLTLTLGKPFW